jgi:hypothetical protein
MAGMLEYLMGPQENQLARIGGAMSSGFDAFQGEQDRQTAAAEKRRLLAKEEAAAKIEAEKRAFEQNKGRLTMLQTLGGNARDVGDQQAVGELYNQAVPLLEQTYGIKTNPLVGGLRQLTDQQVTTMPGNPADYFSFAPDGTPRFATQDFRNEQSQDRAAQLFGPGKDTTLSPGNSIARNGEIIVTAPYAPKVIGGPRTGYSVVDMNGGGGGQMMPPPMAGGAPMPAGPRMVVPPSAPAARGGGGRRSSGGGRGRSGGGSRGGITWSEPDANGYQTGSNGQVRKVTGWGGAAAPKPSGPSDSQIEDIAIKRVKGRPSYRDMEDEDYNAAVAQEAARLRAARPAPQPARPSGPKPGAKKGLAASLIKRLEAL